MSLYKNRVCRTCRMKCESIKVLCKMLGTSIQLCDADGQVQVVFGVTYEGMIRRAFGLSWEEDLGGAVGREVDVWFGVNGGAQRIMGVL